MHSNRRFDTMFTGIAANNAIYNQDLLAGGVALANHNAKLNQEDPRDLAKTELIGTLTYDFESKTETFTPADELE